MPKVFCYGTLKRGHYNHARCGLDTVPFLGTFEAPHLRLWSGPFYPCVTLDVASPYTVEGEVYEVPESLFMRLHGMETGAGYSLSSVSTPAGVAHFWYMKEPPKGWHEVTSGVYEKAA